MELCVELVPVIQRETMMNCGLPEPGQVLAMLEFFATRAFQRELDVSGAWPTEWDGLIPLILSYIKFSEPWLKCSIDAQLLVF